MISESLPLITAIDVVVIAMSLLMVKLAAPDAKSETWTRGRLLIVFGVAVVTVFHAAELLSMYAAPRVIGTPRAIEIMTFLNLEVRWFVTVASLALIIAGFHLTSRDYANYARRLSVMIDALPLALAYCDAEQRYKFVNANYARLHAKSVEQVVGSTVQQIVRADLLPMVQEHNRRALQGEIQAYEHRARFDMDGEMHDMHVDLVPDITADRKVAGFFVLVRDVTAHTRLEREVVRAAEAERLSVARDLHDGLGQSLTGISLALSALARRLEHEGSPHVALVKNLISTTQNTIEQTRQFTHLLAPTMHGGLFSALRALADEVSTLYNVRCTAACPPDELKVSPSVAMHLYRIAQESVNNATRHGRASTIRIECRPERQTLVLEVTDDGIGIPATTARRQGIGLKSMQYRARMIGGTLRVTAGRDGGTRVSCTAPLPVLRGDEPPPPVERAAARVPDYDAAAPVGGPRAPSDRPATLLEQ